MLEKCNVIKKKNPKVAVIRPGEGHLISTLDRSISELYKEIYNIDITQSGSDLRTLRAFFKTAKVFMSYSLSYVM